MYTLYISYCFAEQELHIVQTSDVHGWVYGNRHQPELGDLPDILSYYQHVQSNASFNLNSSSLLIDVGDMCEGTGLSDISDPKCALIFEVFRKMNYSFLTFGNHDGSGTAEQFITDNAKKMFPLKYITTNAFVDKKYLGYPFYFEKLSNNMSFLTFGFLGSQNKFNNIEMKDINQSLDLEIVSDFISAYGPQTDFVLLQLHIGATELQTNQTILKIKEIFSLKYDLNIPILVLSAHTHIPRHGFFQRLIDGNWITDKTVFYSESAAYLTSFQHIVVKKDELGNIDFTEQPYTETRNVVSTLAQRFELKQSEFDTHDALVLRSYIQDKVDELELDVKLGYSWYHFRKDLDSDEFESIYRLLMEEAYPKVVFERSPSCFQYLVLGTTSIRADIYEGDVVIDDVFNIIPFENTVSRLSNFTADEVRCIMGKINSDQTGKLPYYVQPNIDLSDSQCYDFVSSDYELQKVIKQFGSCLLRDAPTLKEYPIQVEGVKFGSQVLRYYIENYLSDYHPI